MNDIFFYYGFIYLIIVFRNVYFAIFPSKKTEQLMQNASKVKIGVSQESMQDLKELAQQANDSNPKTFMILGWINIIWIIVGLKLGVEPFYFSVLLGIMLFTILMGIFALLTGSKDVLSIKAKWYSYILYGIEITACSMILHNHFIK